MKLMLVSDDGEVLDTSDTITRAEWDSLSAAGALAELRDLNPGDAR
jgi:hypothetical protein